MTNFVNLDSSEFRFNPESVNKLELNQNHITSDNNVQQNDLNTVKSKDSKGTDHD